MEKSEKVKKLHTTLISFAQLKVYDMDDRIKTILGMLLIDNFRDGDINDKVDKGLIKESSIYSTLRKRTALVPTKFDKYVLVFITSLTDKFSTAMLYLYYLNFWCKHHDMNSLDLNTLCTSIFLWGFPNEDDIATVWKMQKDGGANLLDDKQITDLV